MTAEAHIWAAMADIHHDMAPADAEPLNDKLRQVIFSIRRAQMERGKVLTAVVNHAEDMNHGLRLVKSGEGPEAA